MSADPQDKTKIEENKLRGGFREIPSSVDNVAISVPQG